MINNKKQAGKIQFLKKLFPANYREFDQNKSKCI